MEGIHARGLSFPSAHWLPFSLQLGEIGGGQDWPGWPVDKLEKSRVGNRDGGRFRWVRKGCWVEGDQVRVAQASPAQHQVTPHMAGGWFMCLYLLRLRRQRSPY